MAADPLDGEQDGILRAAFSDDDKILVVTTYKGKLRLYDATTGNQLHELPHAGSAGIALSPDGKLLAIGGSEGIQIYDVASGQLLRTCRGKDPQQMGAILRFSPDGKWLVSGGDEARH